MGHKPMSSKKKSTNGSLKNLKWQAMLSAVLLLASIGLYAFHFMIFHDSHHIFIYLLGDIAFLPIEVFFITLIINQLLGNRDKRVKLKKLNMVIGTFFSEVGSQLLRQFLKFEKNERALSAAVMHTRRWGEKDFLVLLKQLPGFAHDIDIRGGSLPQLKDFLIARRGFLLSLLGNANLLEHDKFTDLLWAVFHLTDELEHRPDFERLPAADLQHLAQDLSRAFQLLLLEWLAYMRHLKNDYPYLFSLAIRMNPFDQGASAIIK
jgi:hypothetical protein